MSKESRLGVVGSPPGKLRIRLVRVTPMTLGRAVWVALTAVAAVVVVLLSWSVPEPESEDAPAQRIENISYSQCTAPEVAPPSYGTRSLSTCVR